MSKSKEHVWDFGYGEIAVCPRVSKPEEEKQSFECHLMRVNPARKFEVRESVPNDDPNVHDESRAPVIMRFDSLDSLDVLLEQLQYVRKKMAERFEG